MSQTNIRMSNMHLIDGMFPCQQALQLAEVSIETVAHSLAQINRYTGACPYPYSVAQHSVLCSRLAPLGPHKMEALLHDAHECLTGDTSAPIKRVMRKFTENRPTDWDVLEEAWEIEFRKYFDIPVVQSAEVTRVDKLAAALEKNYLFGEFRSTVEDIRMMLLPLNWTHARDKMIETYYSLDK